MHMQLVTIFSLIFNNAPNGDAKLWKFSYFYLYVVWLLGMFWFTWIVVVAALAGVVRLCGLIICLSGVPTLKQLPWTLSLTDDVTELSGVPTLKQLLHESCHATEGQWPWTLSLTDDVTQLHESCHATEGQWPCTLSSTDDVTQHHESCRNTEGQWPWTLPPTDDVT